MDNKPQSFIRQFRTIQTIEELDALFDQSFNDQDQQEFQAWLIDSINKPNKESE
jgi:hypothetical protein